MVGKINGYYREVVWSGHIQLSRIRFYSPEYSEIDLFTQVVLPPHQCPNRKFYFFINTRSHYSTSNMSTTGLQYDSDDDNRSLTPVISSPDMSNPVLDARVVEDFLRDLGE